MFFLEASLQWRSRLDRVYPSSSSWHLLDCGTAEVEFKRINDRHLSKLHALHASRRLHARLKFTTGPGGSTCMAWHRSTRPGKATVSATRSLSMHEKEKRRRREERECFQLQSHASCSISIVDLGARVGWLHHAVGRRGSSGPVQKKQNKNKNTKSHHHHHASLTSQKFRGV